MTFKDYLHQTEDTYMDLENPQVIEDAYADYLDFTGLEEGEGLEDIEDTYSEEDFYSELSEQLEDAYSDFLDLYGDNFESEDEAEEAFLDLYDDEDDFEEYEEDEFDEYDDEEDFDEYDEDEFDEYDDEEDFEDMTEEEYSDYLEALDMYTEGDEAISPESTGTGVKKGNGMMAKMWGKTEGLRNSPAAQYAGGSAVGAAGGLGVAAIATRKLRAERRALLAKKAQSGLTPGEESQLASLRSRIRKGKAIGAIGGAALGAASTWGVKKYRNTNKSDDFDMLDDSYSNYGRNTGMAMGVGIGALEGAAKGALTGAIVNKIKNGKDIKIRRGLQAKANSGVQLTPAEAKHLEKLVADRKNNRKKFLGRGALIGGTVGGVAGGYMGSRYGKMADNIVAQADKNKSDEFSMLEDAYSEGLLDAMEYMDDIYAEEAAKEPGKIGKAWGATKGHVSRNQSTYVGGGIGALAGAGAGALVGRKRRATLNAKVKAGTATPSEIQELKDLRGSMKRNMAIGAVGGAAVGAGAGKYGTPLVKGKIYDYKKNKSIKNQFKEGGPVNLNPSRDNIGPTKKDGTYTAWTMNDGATETRYSGMEQSAPTNNIANIVMAGLK